jgi:hypothetical protein
MHLSVIYSLTVYSGATLRFDLPSETGACLPFDSEQGTYSRRVYQGFYDKESILQCGDWSTYERCEEQNMSAT